MSKATETRDRKQDAGRYIGQPRPRAGNAARGALSALIVLVASFSLLCPELAAKEKRGSKLEVTYRDGYRTNRRVVGELIAVRADSLLLVEEYSEFDRSINVKDIIRVRIIKKPTAGRLGLYGLAVGLCGGVLYGLSHSDKEDSAGAAFYWGAIGAGAGGAAGLLVGSLASRGKIFEFEGQPESVVKGMLNSLRSIARVEEFR